MIDPSLHKWRLKVSSAQELDEYKNWEKNFQEGRDFYKGIQAVS